MTKLNELEQRVLELVLSKDYHPIKPRVIAKKLKLADEDEAGLKRVIKRLIKKGKLKWGPKHLVMKGSPSNQSTQSHSPKSKKIDSGEGNRSHQKSGTASDEGDGRKRKSKTKSSDVGEGSKKKAANEVVGVYRRNSAGFGFVTPDGIGPSDRSEDVYIAQHKASDAADGDVVRIRVSRRRQGDEIRMSGRVLEVIKRSKHRFVGTYLERDDFGLVTVDNGTFGSSILVGDAGAKNCRVGDKVVIEMANFPSVTQEGEGVIVEVLGDRGQPGVDTLQIVREFDLPEEFPEPVLEEARKQAEIFDEAIGDRTDFTKTTVITIDPKTARDFDDAISLEQLENGHWQLGVHIADVSHFVPYRSELDNEAFARATSIYLPDRVIPMLPEVISNNLASLQPDRVRYCMTAMIEFSDDGVPIGTELFRGAIKSAHRFNYEEIDDYLADDKPWKTKLTPEVFSLVRNMHTLAMKLRKRRMDRGSFDLSLPEVQIDLDDDGRVSGAHTVENTESHQVIEEFMLAANEAVAQRLVDEDLYLMRRIHENPSESKLSDLTKFVKHLGIEVDNMQSRFEIKRVIAESEDLPERNAIHFAILRSMQKAVYSPKEIGHYALASDAYCHFTSPIRRYPDLIIHRMVGDLVDGKKPQSDFDRLAGLGKHCSDLERRAEQAERELKKLKLLNFLADKIGMQMEAVVTGVEAYGLFAQGIELPAEGLLPVSNLPVDNYIFDRASRTLNGHKPDNQFRLGDRLKIEVAVVDQDQRLLEFKMIGVAAGDNAARKKKTARKPAGKEDSGRGKKRDPKDRTWEQTRASGRQSNQKRKSKSKSKKRK